MTRRSTRIPPAAPALLRALAADALAAGCAGEIVAVAETPYASATYVGARHVLRYTAPPSRARQAWLLALPEADLILPGHLLADLIVEWAKGAEVLIAALTIEQA